MQGLQINFFILVLFIIFLHLNTNAQGIQPEGISDSSVIKNVIAEYDRTIGERSHIYNGREYQIYASRFSTGNPFFIWDSWQKGDIIYDGTLYKDVSILYDIVRDEVVILHFNNVSKISLIKEKVTGFILPAHTFIQVSPDSTNSHFITDGFYELLYAGKDSLLARRTKSMKILYKQTAAELKVSASDNYYIKKDNNYYTVNNENSFLRLFNNKKEIRKFKKQNRLKFKRDPENTMIKIMSYNDQLIK